MEKEIMHVCIESCWISWSLECGVLLGVNIWRWNELQCQFGRMPPKRKECCFALLDASDHWNIREVVNWLGGLEASDHVWILSRQGVTWFDFVIYFDLIKAVFIYRHVGGLSSSGPRHLATSQILNFFSFFTQLF